MKLKGRYRLVVEGDTDKWFAAGGASDSIFGYLFVRAFQGQDAALETAFSQWGITVEQVDPAYLELPIIPQSRYAEVLAAEATLTPEMIEAGWQVLDAEGIEAPPVEVMEAIYRAMVRAR